MVGSKPCVSKNAMTRIEFSRRPLMVGSKQGGLWELDAPLANVAVPSWSGRNVVEHVSDTHPLRSPSPHGRVETRRRRKRTRRRKKVAVPSWSGRNFPTASKRSVKSIVAVPSWSGRNFTPPFFTCRPSKVAVPSWSGRNQAQRQGEFEVMETVFVLVAVDHRSPQKP